MNTKTLHIQKGTGSMFLPFESSFDKCNSLPERSGMWIACFNVRMKIVLNVKVSRAVGVGADQDPVKARDKECQT